MHAPITHEQSPIPKKMWSSIHPRNFGDHMTVCLPDHPSVLTVGEPTLNVNLLGSVGAWNLILYIHIVVNWQLSKQSIHWPVSHDHIAGSDVNPSRLCVFLSSLLTSYEFLTDHRLRLKWMSIYYLELCL